TTNAALQATWDLLHEFKERGTAALDEADARRKGSRWGAADRGALVDSRLIESLEERFLPESLQRDYDGTFGHTERSRG
ncbi:MAG: hypothetical protein QOF51_2710, partial [Chloroflexota bacterium]|nr:hypothetical protein [Chloroflexota bacterium]